MDILGYSERGFINALLYEIAYQDKSGELIEKLFECVNWPVNRPEPKSFANCTTILVEQSFSQFGVADALFLFQTDTKRTAVFCEGKRGKEYTIKEAWCKFINAYRNQERRKGLTSNLFCQLYFKQRLAGGLAQPSEEDIDVGLTFEKPFDLPKTNRKIGDNPVVGRAKDLLKQRDVYYLMMIPEEWNDNLEDWWKREVASSAPVPRQWNVSRWGVITIPSIIEFCDANGLWRTREVVNHNEGQLYLKASTSEGIANWSQSRKLRGLSIIYAPGIEPRSCLHFSWDGEGCALRNYVSATTAGAPMADRSRTTSQVVKLITEECPLSTHVLAIHRFKEWRAKCEEQNKIWGIGKDSS